MLPRHLATTAAVFAALALVFTGCDTSEESDDSETAKSAEEDEEEARTLTFAFQPQENPEGLQLEADKFAEYISEETGYEVEVYLPTTYASVVEALRSENADVAYFSGLPYLTAHNEADVELLVVEERDGNPHYYSQWYVGADSDIEELADLEERPIAFTSPSSTSGFLFPMAKVIDEGLVEEKGDPKSFFGEVIYAGGYEQALLALVNGQVDAAAASDYAFDLYLDEEQQEQIRVLTRQGPVPTHGLAIRSELPDEVKDKVREALLKLNDEENRELLDSVYGAEKLVERSHEDHVSALDHARSVVDFDTSE